MTKFTVFVGIKNTWLVDLVGYDVRCRDDCVGYCVVNMDDSLLFNSASPKRTK